MSVLLTSCYAFGTSMWPVCSQALWQHGTANLLLLLALWEITDPNDRPLTLAGAAAGLLAVNRPPDALLAAALTVFVLVRKRHHAMRFVATASAAGGLFLLYNYAFFGSILGGYAGLGSRAFLASRPLLSGLGYLLVSPGKGLLFYSPFFLLLLALPLRKYRGIPEPFLAVLLFSGFVLQLLVYAGTDSSGGFSYGPRFLADALPILIWLLSPVVTNAGRIGVASLVVLALVSTYIQAIGAFCYPKGESDIGLDVWSIATAPPFVEARAGLFPRGFNEAARRQPFVLTIGAEAHEDRDGRAIVDVDISPRGTAPQDRPLTVSVDAYSTSNPTHPGGHYAFWSIKLPSVGTGARLTISIDLVARNARFQVAPQPSRPPATESWRGPVEAGTFRASLAVWAADDPSHMVVLQIFDFGRHDGHVTLRPSQPRGGSFFLR